MKMIERRLRSDGEMQLVFRHFANEIVCLERYGLAPILRSAPHFIWVGSRALQEGGRETLVKFPAFNFVYFFLGRRWKPFYVVHRNYGTGIRDCIRLAMDAWDKVPEIKEQGFGMAAFVWRLPGGAENGTPIPSPSPILEGHQNGERVQEVHLFEAEWMPSNCVAVG